MEKSDTIEQQPLFNHKPLENDILKNILEEARSNSTLIAEHRLQRVICCLDIDCFYAQCRVVQKPELRGKPVGVRQKHIIVTCNYPARNLGVKKLMLTTKALEICPTLIIVPGENLDDFREFNEKIYAFLKLYTELCEKSGLDEFFMDISKLVEDRMAFEGKVNLPWKEHVFGEPSAEEFKKLTPVEKRLCMGSQIANEIRINLKKFVGLEGCIGVGWNKLMAKMSVNLHKPYAQTTILPYITNAYLKTLAVRKFPGIGYKLTNQLVEVHLATGEDLQAKPRKWLVAKFGAKVGHMLADLCRGFDDSKVSTGKDCSTISVEDSFKDCTTRAAVEKAANALCAHLWDRLDREKGNSKRRATKLSVKYKFRGRDEKGGYIHNRQSASRDMPSLHLYKGTQVGMVQREEDQKKFFSLVMGVLDSSGEMKKEGSWRLFILNVGAYKFEKIQSGLNKFFNFGAKSNPNPKDQLQSQTQSFANNAREPLKKMQDPHHPSPRVVKPQFPKPAPASSAKRMKGITSFFDQPGDAQKQNPVVPWKRPGGFGRSMSSKAKRRKGVPDFFTTSAKDKVKSLKMLQRDSTPGQETAAGMRAFFQSQSGAHMSDEEVCVQLAILFGIDPFPASPAKSQSRVKPKKKSIKNFFR